MDPIDSTVCSLIMQVMSLQSYDLSDEQIIELFSQIRKLPCQEHGPDCFSNKMSSKLDEKTKLSLRDRFKQLRESIKTTDSTKKLSTINEVFNELKPLVDYVPESKCVTHIIMDKLYVQLKGMVTNIFGLLSMGMSQIMTGNIFTNVPQACDPTSSDPSRNLRSQACDPTKPVSSHDQKSTIDYQPISQQPITNDRPASLITRSRFRPRYEE